MEDIIEKAKMTSKSVIEKILPLVDMYILTDLKKQQLMKKGIQTPEIFLLEQQKQQAQDEIKQILTNANQ